MIRASNPASTFTAATFTAGTCFAGTCSTGTRSAGSLAKATLISASCTLLLAAGCVNESYDGVPVDLRYQSTIESGFEFELDGGEVVEVGAFGIAIGFTRVHECAETTEKPWASLGRWFVPIAHAHSPSTPTSSGIPIILSTQDQREDLVPAALRPVRGQTFCALEVQLLNADDDAHMLDALPEILGTASTAEVDGQWVRSAAGTSRRFELATPLLIEDGLSFKIALTQERFAQEVASIQAVATPQELSDALQDAALRALTLKLR